MKKCFNSSSPIEEYLIAELRLSEVASICKTKVARLSFQILSVPQIIDIKKFSSRNLKLTINFTFRDL